VDKLRINKQMIGQLTVGELELLEERTGRPLSRLFDDDAPRGTLLHSLAFIQLRRDDPATTWEAAADVVVELEGLNDDEEVGTTSEGPTLTGRGKRRA
jgi:hypothetical protein